MWILSKSIMSAYAPGTEASILDSKELSALCEQSLTAKSSFSPVKTWLRRCRRDSWTMRLFGQILQPFLGKSFLDWWTSCQVGSRVSHFQVQGQEEPMKTQDICSHLFWRELSDADLPLFSLKTLKESSVQDCQEIIGEMLPEPRFCSMSSASWNAWVTEQRLDYFQRKNAVPHTHEGVRLSWPTPTTRDCKDTGDLSKSDYRKDGKLRKDVLPRAVSLNSRGYYGPAGQVNISMNGSHQELLNPRWVEALMGIPIGWVMPNCLNPMTIES